MQSVSAWSRVCLWLPVCVSVSAGQCVPQRVWGPWPGQCLPQHAPACTCLHLCACACEHTWQRSMMIAAASRASRWVSQGSWGQAHHCPGWQSRGSLGGRGGGGRGVQLAESWLARGQGQGAGVSVEITMDEAGFKIMRYLGLFS